MASSTESDDNMSVEDDDFINDNDDDYHDQQQRSTVPTNITYKLDCYPYTFSPLLIFTSGGYFDKGYSNYDAVARFFQSVIPVNMLENVLTDGKNMIYEELFQYVIDNKCLVTCCIDAHFSAFQILHSKAVLYYDPLHASCQLITSSGSSSSSTDSVKRFVLFLLMKCNYGDSQHIQDNKEHYTGGSGLSVTSAMISSSLTATRQIIWDLWKNINKISSPVQLRSVKLRNIPLNLNSYYLINNPSNPTMMSTQLTGNTCYFQVFLYV